MSDNWDNYAEGWDINEDVREYARRAFDALVSVINIKGLRILDFGCGTGLLTEMMSPLADKIVALDTSEKMCNILRKKKLQNVDVLTDNLTESLIRSELLLQKQFELIVASSVFAFLDNYNGMLKILKSLLSNGGSLVQWDWKKSEREPNFGFDSETLKNEYHQSGLKTISISEPFSLESEHGRMVVIMGIAINKV